MIITKTCIEDAAEFSIDNADERVCARAYTDFLRAHWGHEGHALRMATKKTVISGLTFEPVINRTEKEPKGPR